MSEFEQFSNQIEILKALFRLRGGELITESLKRMEQIFQTTERKWRCNLNRLKKVKYLLIAEAPPWSEDGEIRYFYNTFQPPLANRIWHAFFPSKILPQNIDIALTALGEQGFLLIDTLPFSMKYSSQFRKKPLYKKLIKECLPFFMKKINDPMIRWAQEVRLAFAFKLNGEAIIEALPGGLPFPNKRLVRLTVDLISADRSGYPGHYKIRKIWGLN